MPTVKATRSPAELAGAVQRTIQAIDTLEHELGITAPKLSPAKKRRTARYRKGGDKVISTVGSIARQNEIELPGFPVSDMGEQLAIASAIEALHDRVTALKSRLESVVFSARADAWQAAMLYYALLRRMARRNGPMAAALKPVTEFMSVHDPRRKRQVGEPTRAAQRAIKKAEKVIAHNPAAAAAVIAKKKKSGG